MTFFIAYKDLKTLPRKELLEDTMSLNEEGEIGRHPAYVWTMIPLCVLAVLLNTVVIFAVTKYGEYKSSVDLFLVNLSVSEILHSTIVFPIHLMNSFNHEQDFYGGNAVCKLVMMLPKTIVMSAVLSTVVMSLERLRCIVHQKKTEPRTAARLIGLIWAASIVVSSPQLYEYSIYEKNIAETNTTIKSCGSELIIEHFETVYASVVFIIGYCMPLAVLVFSYTRILRYIWNHSSVFMGINRGRVAPETAPAQAEHNITKRKLRVLKLVISITVPFIILWTPYFIMFALTEMMDMDGSDFHVQWPHVFGRVLAALSNLINPVIFIIFSDTIREHLKRLVMCRIQ